MTQQKQKYSFDIRVGTTNLEEPVTDIDKVVIANNLDTVIDYCKQEYDMEGMEEIVSDESSIVFEKSYLGQMSDHGNIHEITQETQDEILDNYGEVKEEYQGEYGSFRDVVDINGGEITEKDYQYMISGQYWNNVVDLTESETN
ncbi:MAG TPA: hypothetical protein VF220_05365 [Nitrososphaeraceae archaeon]